MLSTTASSSASQRHTPFVETRLPMKVNIYMGDKIRIYIETKKKNDEIKIGVYKLISVLIDKVQIDEKWQAKNKLEQLEKAETSLILLLILFYFFSSLSILFSLIIGTSRSSCIRWSHPSQVSISILCFFNIFETNTPIPETPSQKGISFCKLWFGLLVPFLQRC